MLPDAGDEIRSIEAYRGYLLLLVRLQIGARLRAKVDASDVVQQAILHAHERRGQFRGGTEGEWLASPANPLTARVMVNRVWLHLFGRGLVPTPDNFGAAGRPPSHPELLHNLAVEFMADGWSIKPRLASDNAKPSDRPGRIPGAKLMGSPWRFRQRGRSGLWVSELFPEVAAHADELCVIRSMHTDLPAYPEAYLMLHTGSSQFIRPSLGAWTLYGLGTESDNLPGFIAVKPTGRDGGAQNDGSASLPKAGHACNARGVDRPIAGLLTDLRMRGLLGQTLAIWGGEFGPTPHGQNADGRDHNNKGFSFWLAGGGVKPGLAYGRTDEFGYEAVEDPVHVHNLHATILHLLGLDHERLTYRYAGRDMRLTDVKGVVHKGILA